MYSLGKFWSIWRITYFGIKFTLKKLNEKNVGKNLKIVFQRQIPIHLEKIRYSQQNWMKKKKKRKNECQNFDKHITMYHCHLFSSSGELQTLRRSLPPKFAWIKNWENKCQNRNQNTTIHSSTKFYFEGPMKDKIHENLTL